MLSTIKILKNVFSLYLISVKVHEYQNFQAFLFPINNTSNDYIQSTVSISLKIEPVEIKKKPLGLCFSLPGSGPSKQYGKDSYEAGLKILLFFSNHHSKSLDENLIL